MNSDGIRLPPRPASLHPSTLPESPQLDLTPEKQAIPKSKQNGDKILAETNQNGSQERNESCSSLAQPSMNSTKRVNKKLMALQKEQFNPAVAIAEELEKSETARTILGEKVSKAVNVKKGSCVYSDLISLEVDTEDLLAECAQHKVRKSVRTNKAFSQEPDIMAFYSEGFETETANFDFDEIDDDDSVPEVSPASLSHVFDLYEHLQCWQQPEER